jgi:ABC-2 type transport system permease protein
MLIGLIGTFTVFYTVQGFGRMLHEENNGLLEPVLATAVSRTQWIMSHIICFGIGTLWLFIVLGLSGGIAAIGDSEVSILRILEASLVTSPGVFVLGGFFVMTFGLIPKFSKPLSWAAILISLIAGPLLGSALNLPENVQKLSPFTHLPGPMDDIKAAPIVILLLLTVIFFTLGIIGFKNRNLKTLKE